MTNQKYIKLIVQLTKAQNETHRLKRKIRSLIPSAHKELEKIGRIFRSKEPLASRNIHDALEERRNLLNVHVSCSKSFEEWGSGRTEERGEQHLPIKG